MKIRTWLTGINEVNGFTLLELLVVMAIISLLAGVGAKLMFLSPSNSGQQADMVERHLRQASMQARRSGHLVSSDCDQLIKKSKIIFEGDSSSMSCFRNSRPSDTITFYPDGSSSGESIEIRIGDDRVLLVIDWLSGNVTRD